MTEASARDPETHTHPARWRQAAKTLALFGLVLAMVGAALVLSGAVSLSAKEGHWAITEAFLRFAKTRSVATHARSIAPPPLDDPALIARGAGHYERGCRGCHGAPGAPPDFATRSMLPAPPDLAAGIDLSDSELTWTIEHGLKFTGMPAWPVAGRRDEVFAVAAFVRAMPTIEPHRYAQLTRPPPSDDSAPEVVVRECARCHGLTGQGTVPGAHPRLAAQSREYMSNALSAYRDGSRPSGIMQTIVFAVPQRELARALEWYSSRPPSPPIPSDNAEAGRRIAESGIPTRRIPACEGCHGPSDHAQLPGYPTLLGQDPRYIREQLVLFERGSRGGSEYAELMDPVANHSLDEAERESVAAFYASGATR